MSRPGVLLPGWRINSGSLSSEHILLLWQTVVKIVPSPKLYQIYASSVFSHEMNLFIGSPHMANTKPYKKTTPKQNYCSPSFLPLQGVNVVIGKAQANENTSIKLKSRKAGQGNLPESQTINKKPGIQCCRCLTTHGHIAKPH